MCQQRFFAIESELQLQQMLQHVDEMQESHTPFSTFQEKMTPLQRTLAVALVTAEVHNRDVLEVLVNKEVSDPQNFLWQAQLR